MKITQKRLKELIYEELSKADVKKIVADEVEKQLSSRKVRKILEDELVIALGKSKSKDEVYKDLIVVHNTALAVVYLGDESASDIIGD